MSPGDAQLAKLMALAQNGDKAAYRAVLDAARRWLHRYFAHRIAAGAIEDLVQDTLASMHAKRASFDPQRPFLPWLAAIARYRWVDQLRRSYRAERTAGDEPVAIDSDEDSVIARISIDRLLGGLPHGQSEAIRLVKIDGLTVAEASARSHQSESLVKVNVHRGLKRLATLIESM